MKKINIEGLEGKTLEFAQAFNGACDKIQELESKSVSFDDTELKSELAALKEASKGTELESKMAELEDNFTAKVNELESKLNGSKKEEKAVNLTQGILDFFETKGIKTISDVKKFLDAPTKDMEFKADIQLSDYTGSVATTQAISEPRFAPLRPQSFIPYARKGTVANDKSIIMWIPATYTANTGYAGEGGNSITENAATATEKTRKMAKIFAKNLITAETFEDLPQFAQRLNQQLVENALYYADSKIWNGDGSDGSNPLHIYGIKTNGVTAFDATTVEPIEKANEADLIDACSVQVKKSQYMANTVWMSPARAFAMRRTKDSNGDYIMGTLITGEPSVNGLRVIETQELTDDEMIVGNAAAIQVWTKRALNMKFGQFGNDTVDDTYTAIVFARIQCLVEDEDKKALIYVSDVNAAKEAISIVGA